MSAHLDFSTHENSLLLTRRYRKDPPVPITFFSVEKPAYGPSSPGKQPDYSQGDNTPAPEPAAPAQPEEHTEENQPESAPSQYVAEEHKALEESSVAQTNSAVQPSGGLKPGYNAEPVLSKMQEQTPNENLPMLGKSPPMSINYQTGEVLVKGRMICRGFTN